MEMQILRWLKFLEFKIALLSVTDIFFVPGVKHEKDEGRYACFYLAWLHSAGHGEQWNRKDCKMYWNEFWGKMSELGLNSNTIPTLSMAKGSSWTSQLPFLQIFSLTSSPGFHGKEYIHDRCPSPCQSAWCGTVWYRCSIFYCLEQALWMYQNMP